MTKPNLSLKAQLLVSTSLKNIILEQIAIKHGAWTRVK